MSGSGRRQQLLGQLLQVLAAQLLPPQRRAQQAQLQQALLQPQHHGQLHRPQRALALAARRGTSGAALRPNPHPVTLGHSC